MLYSLLGDLAAAVAVLAELYRSILGADKADKVIIPTRQAC